MSRSLTMLFAIICYAIFFATFLYLIIFVGDLGFATRTVDVGPEAAPLTAALIDVALIALFGSGLLAERAEQWFRGGDDGAGHAARDGPSGRHPLHRHADRAPLDFASAGRSPTGRA